MRIALLGDIALFGAYSIKNNPQLLEKLSEISNYLKQFDCVVGNLETPFSVKQKTNGAKSAYICADVENIQVLKALNLSAVCLANNHMFDYGEEGYQCTINTLNKAGIPYFGTDGKEYAIENGNNRLMFSGFCCYSSNPLQIASEYGTHGVNCYNVKAVCDIVSKHHSDGYLNIVAVHAGMEHVNYPHTDHILAARKIAEAAPYVCYGHHPHVIQGVEESKDSVLAYSLGNFCFDDVYTTASDKPLVELTENNRRGVILELEVDDNRIIDWKETLIHINNDGSIVLVDDNSGELNDYNSSLKTAVGNEAYSSKRNDIINSRMSDRRSQRNLIWYLKRLRPRYINIILNAKRNAKAYHQNVKQYL